ncbi:hypothetical protein ACWG8W_01130 [Citricoccus zhacaiensis]
MPKLRLTGFTGWIFGAQWDYAPSDKDIAVKLIDKMENFRVLWMPAAIENPIECKVAAGCARAELGGLIDMGPRKELKATLKSIRGHFTQFQTDLNTFGLINPQSVDYRVLEELLENLRRPIGLYLGFLAAQYSIEYSENLGSIIPDDNAWFFNDGS